MDSQQVEKLLIEQGRLARETRRYVQYVMAALALIAIVAVATMALAWKTYSENLAPAVKDMQTTMEDIQDMTAQTKTLLDEAKQTMNEVRKITGAVAPVLEQAQETTEQVQAPLNLLRAIPILNWFMY